MKEATTKASDKVKVTAKDGGETNPTPTRVGGEAVARETKATQENNTTEKSPKKRANPSGKATLATTVILRETSVKTVQRGLQTKPRNKPQQTRHNNLSSKMTSISYSKTRYTCTPMTRRLMTKQWRKKWYTALHTLCTQKPTTPTQSPLRKPPKTITKLRQKSRFQEISQHLPLKGKTGPKIRLMRKPPLATMTEKMVRKRSPHTAKTRHHPHRVNNPGLSHRPEVNKRATQKARNKQKLKKNGYEPQS